MTWLINAAQLDKFRKSQKNVIILDASWHLVTEGRDAKQEFVMGHVVGSRFFDFEIFNDKTTELPNMLTRDEAFLSEKIGELGITNDHKIFIYDNSSLHTSARAVWLFKVLGHNPNQLYVLDGGFSAWEKYGGKIESGDARPTPKKNYTVNFEAHYIRSLVQMKTNLHHPAFQVVDVRHPVRYAGAPETRPSMRAGHIPGSFSFPYITMFEQDGRFKPIEKIRKQLTGIGVELNIPIVSMCGSGMTAAILDLALDLMGQTDHSLYDGSWSEWGTEKLYHGETDLSERPVERSVDK